MVNKPNPTRSITLAYPQETHLLRRTLTPLLPLHSPHKYPAKQYYQLNNVAIRQVVKDEHQVVQISMDTPAHKTLIATPVVYVVRMYHMLSKTSDHNGNVFC